MKHYLYKLTSEDGKSYIGVTKDLKRRMKEHKSAKTPLGEAIRCYGFDSFKLVVEEFETRELALDKEFELVSVEDLPNLYNATVGGGVKKQLAYMNPMKDHEVSSSHPALWTTENNPMNLEVSRAKMISHQKRKAVVVKGVKYDGVREAARAIGESRQALVYRLKSPTFPDYYYV